MTDAATIARSLTKARKLMVLALPANGDWGRVPSRSVAKRAWYNMTPMLIEHKHCPEDANEWALSDHGLSVRAVLVADGGSDG